jgi:predicted dehydrogenase
MFWQGPESWHPDPAFLYQKGAGPLLDSGPYFVTALAYLFGPVDSVWCAAKIVHAERTITSQPRYGQKIKVEVPTFVGSLLSFRSGAIVSMTLSADIGNSRMKDPRQHDQAIEIYGTEGTLVVPSPCFYDGAIYYRKNGMAEWAEIPNLYCYQQDSRGLGVADLASAIISGRLPRVGPDLVYHSFEVLNGLDRAWQTGLQSAIESSFVRTEPLNISLKLGEIDAH